jgi:hypothetical protein
MILHGTPHLLARLKISLVCFPLSMFQFSFSYPDYQEVFDIDKQFAGVDLGRN